MDVAFNAPAVVTCRDNLQSKQIVKRPNQSRMVKHMKNNTLHRYIGSLVAGAVALFASVHVASATQVNVQLTSVEDPASPPDGNYWNVFEFDRGGDAQSVSDALDIDGISTVISVSSVGEYEGWDSYCAETGVGTITLQIDLPCGTFDITPGF